MADKPKVIYVLGAHRSGSTVLGVTLGNCADFVFAGEVHSWLTRSGVPAPGGADVGAFWHAVAGKPKRNRQNCYRTNIRNS